MEHIPASILLPAVMKKAGLIWLQLDDRSPIGAWHVWHGDVCYVLHGGNEQRVPGLAEAARCRVITRSASTRARTAEWAAAVTTVAPNSREWTEVAPLLLANRLNLTDHDTALERWAAECTVSRLELALTPEDPAIL
ncbi:MAG TPA: hypothetical protein VHU91_06555 [Mycobacteriales bacterium]|jgi:hypothetical protein|nr:hypothetical protein [Mycobacteriales bacterium]